MSSLPDFLCILSVCCSMFFKVIYLCMEKSDHCMYLFSAADLYFACQQAHLINVIVQDSVFFLCDSIIPVTAFLLMCLCIGFSMHDLPGVLRERTLK